MLACTTVQINRTTCAQKDTKNMLLKLPRNKIQATCAHTRQRCSHRHQFIDDVRKKKAEHTTQSYATFCYPSHVPAFGPSVAAALINCCTNRLLVSRLQHKAEAMEVVMRCGYNCGYGMRDSKDGTITTTLCGKDVLRMPVDSL